MVPKSIATVDGITMYIIQQGGVGFVLAKDGVPAGLVQCVPIHEGAFSVGLIATDEWINVWRSFAREIQKVVIPALLESGARWMECRVWNDNQPAKDFLEWFGFRQMSEVMTGWGTFGKDFVLYGITRSEFETHVSRRPRHSRSRSAD